MKTSIRLFSRHEIRVNPRPGYNLAVIALLLLAACGRPPEPTNVPVPGNPIAALQQKIDAGKVKLEFDAEHGYLRSLLEQLGIPKSTQTLVFAKSSFQRDFISPATPRALYFNDIAYVGFVKDAPLLELIGMDPKLGPTFYTLSQEKQPKPRFMFQPIQITSPCIACHDSSQTETPIPRLLMLSVLPDAKGYAVGAASLITNDRSLFQERFGGWYVSGTHGKQRHLGNTVVRVPEDAILDIKKDMRSYIPNVDLSAGANVSDLQTRFDTKPFLTPHSDIVALMVLAHQTHVHNLITLAAYEFRADPKNEHVVQNDGESLVRSLLFSGAAPLTDRVVGTSGFAEEFSAHGPRDSHGRSLRDLDLTHRLVRYPLSYLIYDKSFDELPTPVKDYVCRRLQEVLSGKDQSPEYKHLSDADRKAITEILQDTKPDVLKPR